MFCTSWQLYFVCGKIVKINSLLWCQITLLTVYFGEALARRKVLIVGMNLMQNQNLIQ